MKASTLLAPLAALLLTGCVTARIDYGLGNVRRVQRSSYAAATVSVSEFTDFRYVDKKSVSTHAHKEGVYNKGVSFNPQMSDYREVFRGIPYNPEDSYYIAPDRLYWTPSGPLDSMRDRLSEHLVASGVFRAAAPAGARADYELRLGVRRLLALKGRNPVADGLGFFGISALFSSDEVVSADVEWTLVETRSGKNVASGKVAFRDIARHCNFRAKDKPFRLANAAAKRVGDEIVAALSR